MVISGTTVDAADFTVDMTSVTSDQAGRNVQFRDYILKTGTYPHAEFRLTEPIQLRSVPRSVWSFPSRRRGRSPCAG